MFARLGLRAGDELAAPDAHARHDRDASCSVNPLNGVWHCHGCGAGGGPYDAATGVGQTLALSPGQSYTLSFWVGNVYDPGGIFGTTSTVDVLVNGTQVLAATNSRGKGTPKQVWEKFSTTFVAPTTTTSPTATIAFINGDPSNDTTNGLDGVTILAAT